MIILHLVDKIRFLINVIFQSKFVSFLPFSEQLGLIQKYFIQNKPEVFFKEKEAKKSTCKKVNRIEHINLFYKYELQANLWEREQGRKITSFISE